MPSLRNKGSATFTSDGETYAFKHVAAYQTKADGQETTWLLFCQQPIPIERVQKAIAQRKDFSFGDLYPRSVPGHLTVKIEEFVSFHLNVGGTSLSDSIVEPVNELKVEQGRIHGNLGMNAPQEFFDEKFALRATIDAVVLTPQTRVGPAGR